MKRLSSFTRCAALMAAALMLGSVAAQAAPASEVYLVVNAKNPTQSLAAREAVALFTGRVLTFPDGRDAEPFDQADTNGTRTKFYKALTGMDMARINSYWARLRFSGQVQPPKTLSDDKEVIAMLRANPRAIGYLRALPTDPALRVVLVITDAGD